MGKDQAPKDPLLALPLFRHRLEADIAGE